MLIIFCIYSQGQQYFSKESQTFISLWFSPKKKKKKKKKKCCQDIPVSQRNHPKQSGRQKGKPQTCPNNFTKSKCNSACKSCCCIFVSCRNVLYKGIKFQRGGTARNTVWHLANHFQSGRRRQGPVSVTQSENSSLWDKYTLCMKQSFNRKNKHSNAELSTVTEELVWVDSCTWCHVWRLSN